jgi:hypothetical protein
VTSAAPAAAVLASSAHANTDNAFADAVAVRRLQILFILASLKTRLSAFLSILYQNQERSMPGALEMLIRPLHPAYGIRSRKCRA